jgi:hypothetical protein
MNDQNQTACCPKFNPETLDGHELVFQNRLFIKTHYACAFHIPLGISGAMAKACRLATAAEALPKGAFWLCDENSAWGADLYVEVNKEVPGANNVKLNGTYLVKIFEGNYREMPNWLKEMKEFVAQRGEKAESILVYYTTCPKCAKIYGHNYVGLFAKIR